MLELYQAEWCPSSHRVRQRLTELGIDFVARQVQVERGDRDALRAATGIGSIPVLVTETGWIVAGSESILEYLDCRCEETPESEAHRRKAAGWTYAEAV
jgi:glutathione S-transferase